MNSTTKAIEAQIIDAAVTSFSLGPEDQDEALRFGMRVHDILESLKADTHVPSSWPTDEEIDVALNEWVGGGDKSIYSTIGFASAFARYLCDRLSALLPAEADGLGVPVAEPRVGPIAPPLRSGPSDQGANVPDANAAHDDYCVACWNCMPIGETCAVCGRVNEG